MPLLLRTFAWLLEFKRHAKPRCLVALPGLWPSRSFSEYGTQLGPKSVRVHKVLEKETVALNSVRHRGRPRMALPIYRHFCRKVGTGIVWSDQHLECHLSITGIGRSAMFQVRYGGFSKFSAAKLWVAVNSPCCCCIVASPQWKTRIRFVGSMRPNWLQSRF